jgi:hypothetical protein
VPRSVGDEGAEALAAALLAGVPCLQALDLSHCGLSDRGGLPLATSLGGAACRIRSLLLGGNGGLSDATAVALSQVTQVSRVLGI